MAYFAVFLLRLCVSAGGVVLTQRRNGVKTRKVKLAILRVSVDALCLCGENIRRKRAPQRHRESTETRRKLKPGHQT
jgi:hypothetical protein